MNNNEISGLLLLDKAKGYSSNKALQEVKRILSAKKAGHTGSLDPLASGLLPLCFGQATKLSSFFLKSDKTYHATFKLGETTDTHDSEGEITQRREVDINKEDLLSAMNNMVGAIDQIPPMYSALKHKGMPLYKLAREGINIVREPRRVKLYQFSLENIYDEFIDVKVHCSSGFYIRSLAFDLGEQLGCGAHVSELRRTSIGGLSIKDAVTIEQLSRMDNVLLNQQLIDADRVLTFMHRIEIDSLQAKNLLLGQAIRMPGLPSKGLVRIYLQDERLFLGIGLIKQGLYIQPKRLINREALNID